MNILFVTPRLPLPADTGARIRTYNLLKNVAKNNQVTLLSFAFEDNQEAIQKLKELGVELYLAKGNGAIKLRYLFGSTPLSIQKYCSKDLENQLKNVISINKFDLVHFDHLHMAQYIDAVNGIPCVLDEHNVESIILKRCAEIEKSFIKKGLFKSQAKKMVDFESRLISKFSKCLTVSETDKQTLYELSGGKANIEVIPNGVDTNFFSAQYVIRDTQHEESLVFTGSMDWLPNSDAVRYFCKEILPLIWMKKKEAVFYVVGKNPPKDIIRLGEQDKRIIITGLVEDVRPYLASAAVFIAPLRIGGGTRLKILEAMAMEKAVVSTTIGAEGITYTSDKNIVLRDSPEDFADAVLMLLENSVKREALGREGKILVQSNYDWPIITNKLNSFYRGILH